MSDSLQPDATAPVPMHITALGLRQLLDISPDALIVVDPAGMIVMANKQAVELFGYHRGELQHQPLELLMPERFRTAHTGHRQQYFSVPRTRPMGIGLQLFGRRKDGAEFPADISLRPILLDDEPLVIGAIRNMTQRQRAERERAQQVQHIQLQAELINLARDAILVRDPINRVIFWNKGAENLYGWTSQEALGHITHTLLKTHFPTTIAAINEQIEHEGHWEGELTHTRRDGTSVIVESRQVLVRDEQGQPSAILEINRDVTERRSAEQAEQRAHARTEARLAFLQQILDALPSSVYLVYGPDARLMLANRAASSVWGAEWPIDQPMQEFIAANHIRIFDTQGRLLPPDKYATLRSIKYGETVLQHQETIRQPNGASLPVLVNAVVLPSQQRPEQEHDQDIQEEGPVVLVMYQGVTALKEAEVLKDEFVGIAAHELRTPLAALKGFADMLLLQTRRGHGPPLAEWQQEALEEIEQATARLVALTEDLLDVTRLQAGRLKLHPIPTDVIGLVQRVVVLLQQTTTRHRLQVFAPQMALVAVIDTGRIEQVLTNLIGNAIKYSPEGGDVTITVWEEAVAQAVGISVKDSGIGIPKHQRVQIFGRFMRADNASAWGISGTGLGLYLCRELIERHEGRLWFESEEGAGSTFSFTLPLASEATEDSAFKQET
ncbi:MAG: PAS domain S-box protein [Ktedonobacteraceae bacterium]